jgi:hypothetical protein
MSRFAEGMTNTEDDEERENRIDRLQGSLPIYGSHGLVEQDGTAKERMHIAALLSRATVVLPVGLLLGILV